jgi:hypothetical protein
MEHKKEGKEDDYFLRPWYPGTSKVLFQGLVLFLEGGIRLFQSPDIHPKVKIPIARIDAIPSAQCSAWDSLVEQQELNTGVPAFVY